MKYSIIYEIGILGVKRFFLLSRDYGNRSQKHTTNTHKTKWEMHTPYDGAKATTPPNKGKFMIRKLSLTRVLKLAWNSDMSKLYKKKNISRL